MTDFEKKDSTIISSGVNKSFSGTKENGPEINSTPEATIGLNSSISQDSADDQVVCSMIREGKDINEIAKKTGMAMGKIKSIKAKYSK